MVLPGKHLLMSYWVIYIHGFLVCFSVVSSSSFENVKGAWVPQITHHCLKTPFWHVGTQLTQGWPLYIETLAKNKQKPLTPEPTEKLAQDEGWQVCGALCSQPRQSCSLVPFREQYGPFRPLSTSLLLEYVWRLFLVFCFFVHFNLLTRGQPLGKRIDDSCILTPQVLD